MAIVVGLTILLLVAMYVRRSVAVAESHREAEKVVAAALIAVRNGDVQFIKSITYSESIDITWRWSEARACKLLDSLSRNYGLDKLSDQDIRSSVRSVSGVRRELVVDILQLHRGRASPAEWLTWDTDMPTVVMYRIGGVSMVSVALREDGKWKIGGIPPGLSAEVLNYHSLEDAILQGKAVVEPQVDPSHHR